MSAPRIAMVTCLNHREEFVAAYDVRLRTWRSIDPTCGLSVDEPVTQRALLLIDPNEALRAGPITPGQNVELHQVLRNIAVFLKDLDKDVWAGVIRHLYKRSQPENPAEPTGLGAVVVDDNDVTYVRAGRLSPEGTFLRDCWRAVDGPIVGDWKRWDHINVARVLSEGVPA